MGVLSEYLNTSTIIVGICVGIVSYMIYKRIKYNLPPGPRGIPFIGNRKVYTSKCMYSEAAKLTKTYGPVIRISIGMKELVFLNSYETVMEALLTKKVQFAGRPQTPQTFISTDGSQSIGFSQHSEEWWYRKKVAGKALRYYLQGQRLENMVADVCKEVFTAMEKEGPEFDSKKFCRLIIFHMLYDMCFSKKSSLDDPDTTSLMTLMLSVFQRAINLYTENFVPFLKDVWPSKKWLKMVEESVSFRNIIRKEMKMHKDTFNPDNIRDYADSILLSNEGISNEEHEKGKHLLSDTEMTQILGDVFLAGFETSKKTLEWFVYFMSTHPEYQRKCRDEIDTVIGNNGPPRVSDRENLHFLEACVMESIRRGAVGNRGIPHVALCDTSVGGYDIPEGTIVIINLLALHNDPTYWKNVTTFDPNHFLQEDGKINHKPENWLPFSAGRRVCLGEPVVRCELVLIAAHLLQNFVFTAAKGDKHPELGHVNAGVDPPDFPKIFLEKRLVNY